MRQIALDTETTGLDVNKKHRIIEIACVEIINRKITDNHFHIYIDPEREIDYHAFKVHGINLEFLRGKPKFFEVAKDFLEFIKDAQLIIHNANFDVTFLNAELSWANFNTDINSMCTVIDTLLLARNKHPGQRNNLDALCKRYNVDNKDRVLHGALLDAKLLARVYLAMTGGQTDLFADDSVISVDSIVSANNLNVQYDTPIILPSETELVAHRNFLQEKLSKKEEELW